MTVPLRAAIVGARHPHVFPRIDLLRQHSGIELVGFLEDDADHACALEERTGLEWLGMPDLGPIDLAVIEGLDPQVPVLAEMAVAAGARGILLEKPGAHTPGAFYELADRLAEAGVAVEVGYELHYADVVQWCREIVRDGVLGQITASRFHGGCPVGAGAELWQSIPEDTGGLVYTEGCHLLEILYDLFGSPEHVSASIRKLPAGPPVDALIYKPNLFSDPVAGVEVAIGGLVHEDVGTALLEYPTQTVSVDFTAWEPTTWCTDWRIEMYGTNGSLAAILEPGSLRLQLRAQRGQFQSGETVLHTPANPEQSGLVVSYKRQLDSLIERARGQSTPTYCGLGHGIGVMRLLEAIYTSAHTRSWVAPTTVAADVATWTR